MANCLIGLGANLGHRERSLQQALARLSDVSRVQVVAASSLRETIPVGGPAGQEPYLNAAATLTTDLSAVELLAALQNVERELGRERFIRWGARTLDLDLLLYDDLVLDAAGLVVPHPRMAVRRFVLGPAQEIAADWMHPTIGWTIAELFEHLDRSPAYIAFCGPPAVGKTALAEAAAGELGSRLLAELAIAADRTSPSPLFARQIELLDRRQQLLSAALAEPDERWLVSDFWLPQGLAYSAALLSPADAQLFAEYWDRQAPSMPAPRFTVALRAPVETLLERIMKSNVALTALDAERFRSIERAMRALAARPGWGPVLQVDARDPSQALIEIVAAAQATL